MKKQTFKIGNGIIPNFLVLFASAILVLFAALFAVSPVTSQTKAEDAPAENGISLVTSKTIETSIRPNENGSLNIVKDTVVGSTSSAAGYELYISTNSEDENDIYLNGNTENTEATKKIAATTGTFETPAALDITDGATWGYAVAGLGSFDASYNIYTPADTAKFAAMPTIENKQLIRETTTAIADDETEIYYGIKADSSLEPGLYKTEILYTALPKVEPCQGICYDGNGGTGSMQTQNIPANNSIVLSEPSFTRDGYEFYGWDTNRSAVMARYLPGDTVTITDDAVTFYAVWGAPRTAKALLGDNNNLNFVYDANTYEEGDIYTDNIGQTEIVSVYTSLFYLSSSLIKTANFDSSFRAYKPTTTQNMFNGCYGLTTITHPENFNTSNVTNMSSMFYDAGRKAQSDFYLDLTSWDVSNVENMQSMFYQSGTEAYDVNWTLILDDWDVSNVKYMGNMFAHTGRYADTWNLSVNNWDLASLEQAKWMFYYAGASSNSWSLDLSSWDIHGGLALNGGGDSSSSGSRLFESAGTSSPSWSLNLSGWDTSRMTNITGMFQYAGGSSSTSWSLDLSDWNTNNFNTLKNAFESAGGDAQTWSLNIDGWNVSNVINMDYAFANAGKSATLFTFSDLSNWNVGRVTTMNSTFYNMGHNATNWTLGNLGYVDASHPGWNVANVTNMSYMFSNAGYNATTWDIGDISGWNVVSVTTHDNFIDANANSTNLNVVNNQPNWP